jgi:tRNA pseudouridine38-40 synthase
MHTYSAVIEYDGTGFKGFQQQPSNVRTVQKEICRALNVLEPGFWGFSYAGRTDTGVHAKNQVIGFKVKNALDIYRFSWKLNCLLPVDISVKNVRAQSGDFDARRDARLRRYSYYIVNSSYQSVFLKKYSIMITRELDVQAMKEAAEKFIGIKDFSAFCNDNLKTGHNMRQVYDCRIKMYPESLIRIDICANAFLYNMVRIIAGTLIEIGKGQRDTSSIEAAFESKNRQIAGRIAPAKGLFLSDVVY